jgi:alpha-galactosidase
VTRFFAQFINTASQGEPDMPKITFLGAGSTVFAKNVLGDCLLTDSLRDAHIALYDIDGTRLRESQQMLETLNANTNQGRARITAHLGVANRRAALRGANYAVNAIQVGGYKPSTVIDFEIPKRYGLRQTIGDTLGIGGIFRALRTIPVMFDFARDMEAVCPNAWLLNYTNPMAMLTGAMLRGTGVKTVGLCHSVQCCAEGILTHLDLLKRVKKLQWKIAGINHQGWLLEITDGGRDLYPEIKKRAAALLAKARRKGGPKHWDMVRHELMLQFGYYITESSEHSSEYVPYFIKSRFPGLIAEFNIPLDEYPRRCVNQIRDWKKRAGEIVRNRALTHERTHEYGSYIMDAMETDVPFRIGGNVLNGTIITNLPPKACVEVACLVDRNGVQPCVVGDLPEPCAALNRTNINPQLLTIEAALTRNRDRIYQAAMLDPHTSTELTLDQIRHLCDDLIAAHGKMLPTYRGSAARRG